MEPCVGISQSKEGHTKMVSQTQYAMPFFTFIECCYAVNRTKVIRKNETPSETPRKCKKRAEEGGAFEATDSGSEESEGLIEGEPRFRRVLWTTMAHNLEAVE